MWKVHLESNCIKRTLIETALIYLGGRPTAVIVL